MPYGPDTTVVRSTTRTPSSGSPDTRGVYAGRRFAAVAGAMDGRTVLITGGNTGIGKESAVALAADGRAGRVHRRAMRAKAKTARDEIRERSGSDAVDVMELDLADLASVRDFASRFVTPTTTSTCSSTTPD